MDRDGEPRFVAKDVCECLGVVNSRDAVARLDDDEKDVGKVDTLGGSQDMTLISESGLYALIMRSNKQEAKGFRKWVTSEVLPSIRKRGVYATQDFIQRSIDDPDWAISMLLNFVLERGGAFGIGLGNRFVEFGGAEVKSQQSPCQAKRNNTESTSLWIFVIFILPFS